jgi:hypothetical protein
MTNANAAVVLSSQSMQTKLPSIKRIFTIPIPILYNGKLTFPTKGYDPRFKSWLLNDAPDMIKSEISLEEAKEVITKLFKEFCFESEQDRINAIAGLLTPYLRGIYPTFSTRTPVFFYLGNRQRCGKDYLAGITGIVYEGQATEETPLNNSDKTETNTCDELRKKFLSAFIAGRKRMHFSNNRGYINNGVFEQIITSQKFSDRALGRNEFLTFDNEMDFSLSGNIGVGFTPDLKDRCRFVNLFLGMENANLREFENPALHKWVLENRGLILSALYSIVNNWIEKKMPSKTIPFASFSDWARICGGIMQAAGYASPCTPDKEVLNTSGDQETTNMKALFELCYEKYPNQYKTKHEIIDMFNDDNELFAYLDFQNPKDKQKFGIFFDRYINRIFSDIRMVVKDNEVRGSRKLYRFIKEGITPSEQQKITGGN